MNRLLASVSRALNSKGLFVVQESDVFYKIITKGYKEVLFVENEHEGKAVLDLFVSYNPLKGTCRRRVVDLNEPKRRINLDLCYWSVANLAALLWIFFEDVDVLEVTYRVKYVILAYRPRRLLSPVHFESAPYVFRVKE